MGSSEAAGHEVGGDETAGQLVECFDRITALGRSLSSADWLTQSLCPDWDCRGVMVHLVAVEKSLLGWFPQTSDESLPFSTIAATLVELDGLGAEELVGVAEDVFAGRKRELAALSDQQWSQPSPTPVGPADYLNFMKVRIFDFWVHERDMATPLGRPTDDTTAAAATSLDQVHNSLGYIVGKRIGLPDGMSIVFDISGARGRSMAVVVDGRAKVVSDVLDPDVTVSADLLTFMQLACGRVDPSAMVAAGRISWTGDDEWGSKAATSLRFTM